MMLPSEDRPEQELPPRPPTPRPEPATGLPPAVDKPRPTTPTGETRPATAAGETRPATTAGETPPATTAGETPPVTAVDGTRAGETSADGTGMAENRADDTRIDETRPAAPAQKQPFTRIRAAWAGVWAGVVAVILLIVFIGQNTAPVEINFLWMGGRIPTALALLIAGVGGAIIALAVAAARIIQLRRLMRRNIR